MSDAWKRREASERRASWGGSSDETMGILWTWTSRSREGPHGQINHASEETPKPIRKETDVEEKTCAIIAENLVIGQESAESQPKDCI